MESCWLTIDTSSGRPCGVKLCASAITPSSSPFGQVCEQVGDLREAQALFGRLLDDNPANESSPSGAHARARQFWRPGRVHPTVSLARRGFQPELDAEPGVESRDLLDDIRSGEFGLVVSAEQARQSKPENGLSMGVGCSTWLGWVPPSMPLAIEHVRRPRKSSGPGWSSAAISRDDWAPQRHERVKGAIRRTEAPPQKNPLDRCSPVRSGPLRWQHPTRRTMA